MDHLERNVDSEDLGPVGSSGPKAVNPQPPLMEAPPMASESSVPLDKKKTNGDFLGKDENPMGKPGESLKWDVGFFRDGFWRGSSLEPWGFWKKSDVGFVSLPTCVEL